MEKERKVRSDKKRTVAPYISYEENELISTLGYICDLPNKTIGELICREAIYSTKILEAIRGHFRRDYKNNDHHFYLGDFDNKKIRVIYGPNKHRLYMRFYDVEYARFSSLAYSLDCSVSSAVSLLIKKTLQLNSVLYPSITKYLMKNLDSYGQQQVKKMCRYLDKRSPEHYITIPLLLSHVLDKGLTEKKKIKKIIDEYSKMV